MTERKQPKMNVPGHIEVARQGNNVLIRVYGLGNMNIALTMKDFIDESMDMGLNHFALDLANCTGMDSTFMGTIVGVAKKISDHGGWHCMINATVQCRNLLEMIGAANFLICKDDFVIADVETEPLLADQDSMRRLQHIKEAHEHLVDIDERNIERFGAFLAGLEAEMKDFEAGSSNSDSDSYIN